MEETNISMHISATYHYRFIGILDNWCALIFKVYMQHTMLKTIWSCIILLYYCMTTKGAKASLKCPINENIFTIVTNTKFCMQWTDHSWHVVNKRYPTTTGHTKITKHYIYFKAIQGGLTMLFYSIYQIFIGWKQLKPAL